MALPSVDFEYYSGTYGGWLTTEAFHEVLGVASRQVRFVCGSSVPDGDDEVDAWKRAVCAACDAFAEFGEGQVGGFSVGDFKVTHYEDEGTTGAEIATDAIVKELAGTGLMFAGVR